MRMPQSSPHRTAATSALCRTFTTAFLNPGDPLARALRGASYRRLIDQEVARMTKVNVALIAGLLAVAAVLGTVAATRTVSLGAAGRHATNATVAARAKQLDAYAASLRHALAHKPPALPAVPKVPAAPAVSPATQAPSQRIVYQRPPPIVVVKHTHHGDDGFEQADGAGGGGGND
jgi:hypothetical protein